MKIKVVMAFNYGKQHFTSGVYECNDVNVIRHMRRLGYGVVIDDKSPEAIVEEKKPVVEKTATTPAKKKTTKRTTKKATKK